MLSLAPYRITAILARGRVIVTLTSIAILTSCMHPAPSDLDFSRTRASEHGIYRAEIIPEGDSIPQGKIQKWTLHLDAANGAPVSAASVAIDGGMPQHGHGLPTKPRVTRELGNGNYLVEGMKFNMGGWWVVKFQVSAEAGNDTLVFNLNL